MKTNTRARKSENQQIKIRFAIVVCVAALVAVAGDFLMWSLLASGYDFDKSTLLSEILEVVFETTVYTTVYYLFLLRPAQTRLAERTKVNLELRQSEEKNQRYSHALMLLSSSTADLKCENLEEFFRRITESATTTLEVARASIWLFDSNRTVLRCVSLYEAKENRHSKDLELRATDYPGYFHSLESHRTVAAHDAAKDPRTKEFAAPYLFPLGITSMLDAAIRMEGKVVGVLCLEHIGPARVWTNMEESFAGSLTDLVTLSMERSERLATLNQLQENEERLRLSIDGAELGVWDWDIRRSTLYHDFRSTRMLGYDLEDFRKKRITWDDLLHPEERDEVMMKFHEHIEGKTPIFQSEHRLLHQDGRWIWVLDCGKVTSRDAKGRPIRMAGTHLDITSRKHLERKITTANLKLQRLTQHIEEVQEAQKRALARELHDGLGQILTSIKTELSILEDELPQENRKLARRWASLQNRLSGAIDDVRKMVSLLRPRLLDELGLSAALTWITKDLAQRCKIQCTIHCDPRADQLNEKLSLTLFRILQESLTNIERHAGATKVEVDLLEENGYLVLRVEDDGKGIEEQEISSIQSHGIVGIRERVARWNGAVWIAGTPGQGTSIKVTIPLHRKNKDENLSLR